MLVATPGQAATYSLLGSGAPKKTCISSSATPKSTTSTSLVTTSNSAASTLMKTISVRLNRGTEFLKDTVQKALINNTTSSKNITTTTSNISFRNTNINNFNTATIASLKHNKTTSAVAIAGPSSNTSTYKPSHSVALTSEVPYSGSTSARTSITANHSSKSLKLNTVPPTNIHRYPQERNETSSTDSINKELCHFKPIISAPTIRWKCGSKSRGVAAIKIPMACPATNVKNLNCDDCSIVSAYSSEDDQPETEKEKLMEDTKQIYRPKPSFTGICQDTVLLKAAECRLFSDIKIVLTGYIDSTLLTTIITSPTHQSAFVRLVAQMKTLVNTQQTAKEQTHSRTTKKIDHYKMRHAASRSRASKAAVSLKMSQLHKSPLNVPLTQIFLRSRKESFVQMKNLNLPTDLIVKKGKSDDLTKATSKPTKAVKDKKITPTSPLHFSTKKGKRNATKSKVLNIVAFAQKGSTEKTNKDIMESKSNLNYDIAFNAAIKHKQRKRKSIEISKSTNKVHSSEINEKKTDIAEPLRKSARLSKDGSTDLLIGTVKRITLKKRKMRSMNKRLSDSFSPPMTRSRLKELMQQHSITSDGSNSVQ